MTPPARAASRYASIWKRPAIRGQRPREIAAHSTRDRKEIHSPAEVLAAHRQIAAEFGNQADKVVTEARRRGQEHAPERARESSQQVARQAVTFARDRSFEREAVTDERELYRDALRRGMSETTYSEVRAGFEARIAAGEFQLVPGQKHDSGAAASRPPRRSAPRKKSYAGCNRGKVAPSRSCPYKLPSPIPKSSSISMPDSGRPPRRF